ncbi:DUF732 domain-containing protein [Mycobacterium malmoense]|uniref:DUF732 domain-containing protein n=1 Tax=Mycobacterium malmoense TaxID=1780 RepID=UPI0008F7F7A2|nr:DUF732 domain-containing protein [Mycobacterium malmoense]OIN80847.1 hypothetical protein BMG05_10965 [Mycobacterium malmoense]
MSEAETEKSAAGPCADETVLIPPATKAGPELAWSAAGVADDPLPARWRAALRSAGLVFMTALAVAGTIVAAGRHAPRPIAEPLETPRSANAAPTPGGRKTTGTAQDERSAIPSAAPAASGAPPSAVSLSIGPPAEHEVTPPPAMPPTPSPVFSSPGADSVFLVMLRDYGIVSTQGPDAAIRMGHNVCALSGEGQLSETIAEEIRVQNPYLTPSLARSFVDAATTAYCPQHS